VQKNKQESEMREPYPGTKEARIGGCLRAVIDNHHGAGRYGDGKKYGWFVTGGCPLHDTAAKEPKCETE
jgi:hypothetical protein